MGDTIPTPRLRAFFLLTIILLPLRLAEILPSLRLEMRPPQQSHELVTAVRPRRVAGQEGEQTRPSSIVHLCHRRRPPSRAGCVSYLDTMMETRSDAVVK
jgi:hypothetical protein